MDDLRISPQMQVFYERCEAAGLPKEEVWPRVRNWCKSRGVSRNEYRSLERAVVGGRSTKRLNLLADFFCAPAEQGGLETQTLATVFDVRGRVPEFFGRFAKQNDLSIRHLEKCVGEFEIVRAGWVDIEADRNPDWAAPDHQIYDLKVWSPGNGGSFVFRYSDRNPRKEKQNRSRWEGHAFATADAVWLIGVEPREGLDAVLFVLQEHEEFGFDVLIGVQLAKLDDGETLPGHTRELGVSRRVAAFRQHCRRHPPITLKNAAQSWVEQKPLGAVTPFRTRRNPTARSG